MKRMWIGLLIAAVVIAAVCIGLNNYLSDYLIDDGDWPPSLDMERFLYDSANSYIDSLYETTEAEGRAANGSEPEASTQSTENPS